MYYCKGMILCMSHCHVLYNLLEVKLLLLLLPSGLLVAIKGRYVSHVWRHQRGIHREKNATNDVAVTILTAWHTP